MNIKSAIMSQYHMKAIHNKPDVNLLFKVVLTYIEKNQWNYHGEAYLKNVLELPETSGLNVNCFTLTEMFVQLCQNAGYSPDDCITVEIPNFVSKDKSGYSCENYSVFHSLQDYKGDEGLYEFTVHCIAKIDGACFDLLLQARYPLVNDGVDILSCLGFLMEESDLGRFESLLPFLIDINEPTSIGGWTLMHLAMDAKKYDFAQLLLKNGARDDFSDESNLTPLGFLNDDINNPSTSLEKLQEAQEYLKFKMELIIEQKINRFSLENQAATAIQPFGRELQNARTEKVKLKSSNRNGFFAEQPVITSHNDDHSREQLNSI